MKIKRQCITNNTIRYEFSAQVWQHPSPGGWHFVTLPAVMSEEIRKNLQWQEEGWGRLKAVAKTGSSEWETAIWYDTAHQAYLLPIKASVRKKEVIVAGSMVHLIIRV